MNVYYKHLVLETSEDVYVPAEDSFLLAENIKSGTGDRVLDVGTGCGIQALVAAKKSDYVLGVDINPKAVLLARKNAASNRIANAEFLESDLFSSIGEGEKFNLIVFNPPYLPVSEKGLLERSWSGGVNGIEVLERFLSGVKGYLAPGGRIFTLISSLNDRGDVERAFMRNHLSFEIASSQKIPFETLYAVSSKPKDGPV
jgi:release factor glutamine methyltransferase